MITSGRNVHVQRARKLQKRGIRDRTREFIIEGVTAVREAVAAGAPIQLVFQVAGFESVHYLPLTPLEVSESVMGQISQTTSPPGILAIAGFIDVGVEEILQQNPQLLVLLADVRDPGNTGTIFRAAWASGADLCVVGEGTVDVYNPKTVRAASGALFNLPFSREVALPSLLEELGRLGIKRVATDPRAVKAYYDLDMRGPIALIMGNESWGIPEEVKEHVDEWVSIPMRGGAESLNVAMAASVILFENLRQKATNE